MSLVAYRYRIALQGVEPEVWRRIEVPGDYSFWDLHVAIQDSMGWLDYHLHLFTINDPVSGETAEIGIPNDDPFVDEVPCLAGWEVPIARFFRKAGDTALYQYDFGDDWQHTVTLDEIVKTDSEVKTPRCLDGARACPPEDCGGPPGYEHLLDVLRNRQHPEFSEMMQWTGGTFDPEAFEPANVNFDDPHERWGLAFEEE